MTTEAMSSLGYGLCAMVLVVAFLRGMAALKGLLLQYCRKGSRPCSKNDHARAKPSK